MIDTAENTGTIKSFTSHKPEYRVLLAHMQATLEKRLELDGNALFHTEDRVVKEASQQTKDHICNTGKLKIDLNKIYLNALSDEIQHHTCSCCTNFLRRFGDLVTIDAEGETHSAVWDASTFPEDNFYYNTVKLLQHQVEVNSQVIGPHYREATNAGTWGDQVKGNFEHFFLKVPQSVRFTQPVLTGKQYQSHRREARRHIAETIGINDLFTEPMLAQLERLLDSEALKGAEVIQGPGRWIIEVAKTRRTTENRTVRENLLWRAIGLAPEGFLHPTSTMVNTVLDDISKGKSFAEIQRGFSAKTSTTVYQRPTAEITDVQIKIAEELFQKMELAPALRRRVATFADIPERELQWKPTVTEEPQEVSNAIFGHLKTKDSKPKVDNLDLPGVTMSWNKFSQEILPEVTRMSISVPPVCELFVGLVTAAVADAPRLFSHDTEEVRNPVTSYIRHNGNGPDGISVIGLPPNEWGILSGFQNVQGIIKTPTQWNNREEPNRVPQLIFVIENAFDTSLERGAKGLCIFPTLLRSELHEVRRVIEKFSNEGGLEEAEGGYRKQVVGLSIAKGSRFSPRLLRVQTSKGERDIIIDRWE